MRKLYQFYVALDIEYNEVFPSHNFYPLPRLRYFFPLIFLDKEFCSHLSRLWQFFMVFEAKIGRLYPCRLKQAGR